MANALSSTASAFSRDNDPEFVRLAAPSTLKMVEMLLDDNPSHPGLLMTACSGFTQYAYGFLQVEGEMLEPPTGAPAQELRARGSAMYARARDYCGRALEVRHSQARDTLARTPGPLLASAVRADVPALYWTAVAWGESYRSRTISWRASAASRIQRDFWRAALAIEGGTPSLRLSKLIAQKRARFLLARIDRLF